MSARTYTQAHPADLVKLYPAGAWAGVPSDERAGAVVIRECTVNPSRFAVVAPDGGLAGTRASLADALILAAHAATDAAREYAVTLYALGYGYKGEPLAFHFPAGIESAFYALAVHLAHNPHPEVIAYAERIIGEACSLHRLPK